MNGYSTARPGKYELRLPPLVAPAEISHYAEPPRPRSRLLGIMFSLALSLAIWGGIAALVLG